MDLKQIEPNLPNNRCHQNAPQSSSYNSERQQERLEVKWIDLDAVDTEGNTALLLAVQSNRMSVVRIVLEKAIRQNKFNEVLNKQNDQRLDARGIAIKFLNHSQLEACMSIFEEMAQLEQRRQQKKRRYSLNSRTSSRALLLRRNTTRAQSVHLSPQTMFRLNKRGNASSTKESNGSRYKSVKGDASKEEDEDEHSAGASDIEPEFEDTLQLHSRSSESAYTKKSPSLHRGRSDFTIVKSEDDATTKETAQPKTSLPTLLNGKSESEILRPPPHSDMPTPQASLLLSLGDKLRNLMHTRSHANKRDYRAASSDGHRRRQTITALDADFSGVSPHIYFDEPPNQLSGKNSSRHNCDSPSDDDISQNCSTAERTSNEADKSTSMSGYSSKLVDVLSGAGGRRWRPSTAKFTSHSSSNSNRAATSYGRSEEVADTDEFHSLMHQSSMAGGRPNTCVPHTQHVQFDEDLNTNDGQGNQEVKKRLSSSSFKIFRSRASSEGRHRHKQNKKGSQYEG